MSRYLVSVTTPSYVPKGIRYWHSVARIRSCKPVAVLMDFRPETDPDEKVGRGIREWLPYVEFRNMPLPTTHSHYMVQHGRFLEALPDLKPDDLVILTDTDVQIQRDVKGEEWDWLDRNVSGDRLAAYWNCLKTDNLELEGQRIQLSGEWKERYGDDAYLRTVPCYNCGVLCGRVRAFRNLQFWYEQLCDEFYRHAPHRCRCQFLINYVVHRSMGGFVTLPDHWHQHGHLADPFTNELIMPAGFEVRGRVYTFGGEPIIFAHNLPVL
jgi:hypothetical protein